MRAESEREGEMEDGGISISPTQTLTNRSSLKSHSHFNNYHFWKHKLRENCYKRVREDRTRLLWKSRLPSSTASHSLNHNQNQKDLIKSSLQDIVSDELRKIKDSSLNDCSEFLTSAPEANDVLWEYDGLCNAYQGECEEILLEMQRIFYDDLGVEPTRKEPDSHVETWEEEEDEYLARAVYEHMQLNDEQVCEKIWCPICKQGELLENYLLIYCSLCELKLNKDNEVSLDLMRVRLAEAHAEHLDRGCRLKPKFCMETRFDLTALYICCPSCNIFEVVM
ncbi:hypothetical protein F2P56_024982 [Juglans regia]|uniref:RPA-interacting protein B-like n=2 Tax=Juglans regia TaxID=51240 RepID=A0A833TV88_JUGRE|nr:uncharacterized protein LOC109007202 isoform X1 [Juglans regia]KAF5455405.1 hypothetical protein F2P56_024982 [Juglans regia]